MTSTNTTLCTSSRLEENWAFYERFGDQTVWVARWLEFAAVGSLPRRHPNHRTGGRCCTSSRLPAFGPRRTVSR